MASGKTALFNLAMAVLMGAAAAFAVFAMPADIFGNIVAATGLPSLLSAAQPPLGPTARLAAMTAVALPLAALVWFGLRALDAPRRGVPEVEAEAEVEDGWAVSRLRRADAHPDAPLRRPLLATEDVGEPLDEPYRSAEHLDADAMPAPEPAPLPVFLAEPVPAASDEPAIPADVDALELNIDQIEPAAPEPAPLVANDEADEDPVDWGPAPLQLHAEEGDEGMTTEELLARLPLPPHESASVSNLIQRLNAGLASTEWPIAEGGENEDGADVDERLRNVLQDLQKMAGGAGATSG